MATTTTTGSASRPRAATRATGPKPELLGESVAGAAIGRRRGAADPDRHRAHPRAGVTGAARRAARVASIASMISGQAPRGRPWPMPSISTSRAPGIALRGRAAAGRAHELVLGAVDDGRRDVQPAQLRACGRGRRRSRASWRPRAGRVARRGRSCASAIVAQVLDVGLVAGAADLREHARRRGR